MFAFFLVTDPSHTTILVTRRCWEDKKKTEQSFVLSRSPLKWRSNRLGQRRALRVLSSVHGKPIIPARSRAVAKRAFFELPLPSASGQHLWALLRPGKFRAPKEPRPGPVSQDFEPVYGLLGTRVFMPLPITRCAAGSIRSPQNIATGFFFFLNFQFNFDFRCYWPQSDGLGPLGRETWTNRKKKRKNEEKYEAKAKGGEEE